MTIRTTLALITAMVFCVPGTTQAEVRRALMLVNATSDTFSGSVTEHRAKDCMFPDPVRSSAHSTMPMCSFEAPFTVSISRVHGDGEETPYCRIDDTGTSDHPDRCSLGTSMQFQRITIHEKGD